MKTLSGEGGRRADGADCGLCLVGGFGLLGGVLGLELHGVVNGDELGRPHVEPSEGDLCEEGRGNTWPVKVSGVGRVVDALERAEVTGVDEEEKVPITTGETLCTELLEEDLCE